MISRRLSVVSFDAVSTLIKPGAGGVGVQYASAAERLAGWRFDPDLLQSSFLTEFKRQRASFPNYGYHERDMSTRRWWTEVVVNTFKRASRHSTFRNDADGAAGDLNDVASFLFDNFEWDLYPHADQLLRHLKEVKRLKLCVVSNSDERLSGFLRDKGVAEFFDLILTSRDSGVEKPDPEMFRSVLRHFGGGGGASLRPEAVMHVGDDVVCDFEAARRMGMRALLVDHRRKMPKEKFVCYDLEELTLKVDEIVETQG